ncbi:hypothetical protein B4923_12795 [Brenneria roseae subsp. americana]|uniref:NERD domain-containing protein n=1 Tax=Brenneria roseae subsp. americana TaxID=1508507 RepID=A0A2U1TQQ5_9GAMM|nr:hypothetical protein [Brenneria roseae]PWC11702.1 hypothetical protein B4923_12795 [Brenneria roseae subsp. americana]
MEFYNWTELTTGFFVTFIILTAVKFRQLFKFWRNSFYTEIYSSFIEFLYRRKNLQRMSQSYWLKSQLGDHRICFQMARSHDDNDPQAYIVIMLSSGVYLLQIKNYIGEIIGKSVNDFSLIQADKDKSTGKMLTQVRKIENPIKLMNEFSAKWEALTGRACDTHKLIVFSDKSIIKIKNSLTKDVVITNRLKLFESIKNIHQEQLGKLSANEIEDIYTMFLTNVNDLT